MLTTTLRIVGRNALALAVLAVILYAPALVLELSAPDHDRFLAKFTVGLLLDAVMASLVTYAVVMELRGTRPSYRVCASIGVTRIPAVVAVSLVSLLAIGGGLVLLVVPGIVIMLMLFVAVPAAVVERLGVNGSLSRSKQLTDDNKGKLVWIVVALAVINHGARELLHDVLPIDAAAVTTVIVQALKGVISAVAAAVAYTALRDERAACGLEAAGQVPVLATAVATVRER